MIKMKIELNAVEMLTKFKFSYSDLLLTASANVGVNTDLSTYVNNVRLLTVTNNNNINALELTEDKIEAINILYCANLDNIASSLIKNVDVMLLNKNNIIHFNSKLQKTSLENNTNDFRVIDNKFLFCDVSCHVTCNVFENLSVTTLYKGTLSFENNVITDASLQLLMFSNCIYELAFNKQKYVSDYVITKFIENYKTAFDIDIYENEDVKLISQKVLTFEFIQDNLKDITLTSLINSDTMTVNK